MDEWAALQMTQVAYVMAQTVAASARIEGMKVFNLERENHGFAPGYDEAAFEAVINEFGLHSNALITNLATPS